ncbi:MAG: undecaprenyl-phosphate glucose phosphotransferase [Inquilinaceae bacterium]
MTTETLLGTLVHNKAKPISPQILRSLVIGVDMLMVLLSAVVVKAVILSGGIEDQYINAVAFALVCAVVVFRFFDCYSDEVILSNIPRLKGVTGAWLVFSAVMVAVAFSLKISSDFSRLWAGGWFVSGFVMIVAGRFILTAALTRMAERGYVSQRAVIVGAGEIGVKLANHLRQHSDLRLRVVGFVDDRATRTTTDLAGYPVLGTTEDLVSFVRQERIDQVIVALPWSSEDRIKSVMAKLTPLPVNVMLAPDLINFEFPHRPISRIGGLMMVNVFERPLSGWSSVLKTIEDRVIATAILLLIAPLLAVIALAIKFDSSGPVLFRQKRYGFNNKLIDVFKFRTMYHNLSDQDCAVQTVRNDPRVTRVGAFLRRTSLDELPQLFNVLIGDMSVVGPRPHAVATKAAGSLFEEVVNDYAARHKVKPGITGWAQVNGWRGETDTVDKIVNRVEYDLYYIENWSIWLDLWIIFRTFFVFVGDKNAY